MVALIFIKQQHREKRVSVGERWRDKGKDEERDRERESKS